MKKLIILYFIFYLSYPLFSQNLKDGYIKFNYPNGSLSSEGLIRNGKPDGFWISYYVTGIKKSEGLRTNFLLDSTWNFYNENGDTNEIVNYYNGKKNGYYIKYSYEVNKNSEKIGYISSKELYLNDVKEGKSYYYHSNGNLKELIEYKNGKPYNSGVEYNDKGYITGIKEYRNGNLTSIEKINSFDKSGNKNGIWREYYTDGKIKKEENYKNDELDGVSKEFDEKGKTVSLIRYKEGNIDSKTDASEDSVELRNEYDNNKNLIHSGTYKGNVPIGIHRFYNDKKEVINTIVYNESGIKTAEGIIKENGKRNGHWKSFFENGSTKYEGDYNGNKRNGIWKYYFKNGILEQTGIFKNDKFDGLWTWYYENGKVLRTENFILGKENGLLIELSINSDTITVGNYSEGEKTGFWQENVGDMKERGFYNNGYKEGIWKSFYSNENLFFIGSFIQGNQNGKHVFYYDNKKIQEERYYQNSIKIGNWSKYNENGQLLVVISYKNNDEYKINGIKISDILK